MQNEILRIWQSEKNTMVMVTHNFDVLTEKCYDATLIAKGVPAEKIP